MVFTGVTALLSGCAGGGGGYSVYGGYGYPHYGYNTGYNSIYYDDNDLDSRHERVEQRREDREDRIDDMNSDQRRLVSHGLQQTRPQRTEQRQVRQANRSSMGRPRGGGGRRR